MRKQPSTLDLLVRRFFEVDTLAKAGRTIALSEKVADEVLSELAVSRKAKEENSRFPIPRFTREDAFLALLKSFALVEVFCVSGHVPDWKNDARWHQFLNELELSTLRTYYEDNREYSLVSNLRARLRELADVSANDESHDSKAMNSIEDDTFEEFLLLLAEYDHLSSIPGLYFYLRETQRDGETVYDCLERESPFRSLSPDGSSLPKNDQPFSTSFLFATELFDCVRRLDKIAKKTESRALALAYRDYICIFLGGKYSPLRELAEFGLQQMKIWSTKEFESLRERAEFVWLICDTEKALKFVYSDLVVSSDQTHSEHPIFISWPAVRDYTEILERTLKVIPGSVPEWQLVTNSLRHTWEPEAQFYAFISELQLIVEQRTSAIEKDNARSKRLRDSYDKISTLSYGTLGLAGVTGFLFSPIVSTVFVVFTVAAKVVERTLVSKLTARQLILEDESRSVITLRALLASLSYLAEMSDQRVRTRFYPIIMGELERSLEQLTDSPTSKKPKK